MWEIDQSIIDETWHRIRGYDHATAVAEAQRFAREQPAVLRFIQEFLREFDEGTRGTALALAYFLFRVVEATRREPVPSLSSEQIVEGYSVNIDWLDALERMESAPPEHWQDHLPQSPVALYILHTYALSLGKQGPYDSRTGAHLLILLKTLLDSFEAAGGKNERQRRISPRDRPS